MKRLKKYLAAHPIVRAVVYVVLAYIALALVSYVVMAIGTRHGTKRTVPDFVGLHIDDARYFASRRDLCLVINDSLHVATYPGGVILDQLPKGGVEVKAGRKIYLTINSFRQKMVPLPFVAGRSLRQAKNMIEGAGLQIAELRYEDDIATNYVLGEMFHGQEITDSTRMDVEMGSGVVLRVGVANGQSIAGVPNLIGRTAHEAKSRLWESGFNIGTLRYEGERSNDARVIAQSVLPGIGTRLGTAIGFTLSCNSERVTAAEKEYERLVEASLAAEAEADSLEMTQKRVVPTAEEEFFQ